MTNDEDRQPAPDRATAAMRLTAEADMLALELVTCAMSNPIEVVTAVRDVGFKPAHVTADDLQLIWGAIEAAVDGGGGAEMAIDIAAPQLRAAGHWDDSQVVGNFPTSARWNDRLLDHALRFWHPTPTPFAATVARRLKLIAGRFKVAEESLERAARAMGVA